jgi:HD-like signal output (HDOD) protein
MRYKLVSEAFVTGLMHDIGLLILMDRFRNNFAKVIRLQAELGLSLLEAELKIFECTHCDVGA